MLRNGEPAVTMPADNNSSVAANNDYYIDKAVDYVMMENEDFYASLLDDLPGWRAGTFPAARVPIRLQTGEYEPSDAARRACGLLPMPPSMARSCASVCQQ